MKRSRIKPTSKDRAAKRRIATPLEQAFLVEFKECWFCGGSSQCIHHMASGSHRDKALTEPLAWAAACVRCNEYEVTDYQKWPLERQLARKKRCDPKRYDREAFNRLRGRGPEAISASEVTLWMRRDR